MWPGASRPARASTSGGGGVQEPSSVSGDLMILRISWDLMRFGRDTMGITGIFIGR